MKYIIKKIIILILTLLAVSVVTFTAFHVIVGDSDTVLAGTEGIINSTQEKNENVIFEYFSWLLDVLQGDFGDSSQFKMPVTELIGERLLVTLQLSLISIFIIVLLAFPIGIICARRPGGFLDNLLMGISNVLMSTPEFFMGMILIIVFGVVFNMFTPGGYVSPREDYIGFLSYMIMPAFAIALPKVASLSKFLRNSVVTELKKDYVRTAVSKGAKEGYIMYRHILKNALMPVITFLAIIVAQVFAGSIVAEQVFSVPGIGRLLVSSVLNRDYNVCSAILLYVAFVVVLMNMLADTMYHFLKHKNG